MRKYLLLLLTAIFFISTFTSVIADTNDIDVNKMAVYLNGNFNGASAVIEGDIYTANGNAEFAWGNEVTGNIYLKEGAKFIIPNNATPDFANRVRHLQETVFDEGIEVMDSFPEITNYISSYTASYWPLPDAVIEDTHYGTLRVENYLKIDVTNTDRHIVVDDLTLSGSGYIELVGEGKLFLYVNNSLSIATSCTIKNGSNPDKTTIYSKGSINLTSNNLFANIYIKNNIDLSSGFNLTGNIITTAENFKITASSKTYGVVYAPNADAVVSSGGTIYGKIIAKSLTMSGKGKIVYDGNANFEIPTPEPTPEPTPPPIDIPEGAPLINFPYAYLYGYGDDDGNVGAKDPIKREEAVTLLYRLLKQDNQLGDFSSSSVEPFENVEEDRWSRTALEYAKHIGVYTTSYISVQEEIVRGEVAKLVSFSLRLRPLNNDSMAYKDIDGSNQYYNYIKALSDIDVLKGDKNNNIMPNENMTRAEFITMINRLIGRQDEYEIKDSMNPYPDLSKNDGNNWPYNDIMRASFGYFDEKDDGIYRIDENRKPDRNFFD